MAWKKGETGNPGGRPKRTDVRQLCARGSKHAVKLLREYVEGKRDCSDADRIKAAMYILDRVEAKPVADGTGGMFQGATIQVHTGFQDAPKAVTAPTIDMPVNGADKDSPTE
jgi:hypothetical protein